MHEELYIGRYIYFFTKVFLAFCKYFKFILVFDFLCNSVSGALAVIIGLYMVLWGKAKDNEEIKEEETKQQNNGQNSRIDLEQPLLSEIN